jgi:hypothetical protein
MRTHPLNKADKGAAAAKAANGLPNPHGNTTPKKKYDKNRPYYIGDEAVVRKCYGRTNGLPENIIDTIVRVERDEDNVGTVKIASALLTEPIVCPVCNLELVRAVEDIPQFSIFAKDNGLYITTKGLDEAVGAVWYGGRTGILQKDAQAVAELILTAIRELKD